MAAPSTTPGLFDTLPAAIKPLQTKPESSLQFSHLWLAIHLPCLALEALPETKPGPVVVVDGEGSNSAIHVANAAARRYGIHAGTGLNAAYALCPELQAVSRDLRREQLKLDELASWATRYTPWVNINAPADLLLEVRGSLHLFGGAEQICASVCAQLEHELQLAIAPTPLAALWFAQVQHRIIVTESRYLTGALGKLPLRCLEWPDKTLRSLHGMGVYTVRDCLRLPRDGFARRFGRRYLAELDRALGRVSDPRPSFIPPSRFSSSVEMPAETSDTRLLLLAARQLLDELGTYLVARQAGVQNIGLQLLHADLPATRVRIGLLEHSQGVSRLFELVRLRLDALTLPAPVIALTLSSGKVTTLIHRERSLFAQHAGNTTDWSNLLENLRTRLGVSAIFSVTGVADHRPESAWCRVEPCDFPTRSSSGIRPPPQPSPRRGEGAEPRRGEGAEGEKRPLWLLPKPQRLRTIDGRPEYGGVLTRESGPERIETGWWDGGDVTRDYYIALDLRGRRLWIYRERSAPRDWYLHGYFG